MASSSVINQPKRWGVTRPRSTDYPTDDELASTCRLVEVLAQYYPHKSKEEHNKQKAALEKLEHIVKDWVRQLPTERAGEANAKLFPFGSYRLQVDEPGSVIDTLCVGPAFVKREDDFFITLRGKLEKMSEVIGMECVHDLINFPFLSFKLDGVAIKLVYAGLSELSYRVIPENLNICDDSVIANVDAVTLRTLGGSRITESILILIPNLENFRTALMCVKYLGECEMRLVSGFLSDREWPILVARVCQAYPNAAPSKLVTEFFNIFARWCWPNPIMLCPIEHMGFTAWDPKRIKGDRNHCMPIMCPAYPHENLKIHATTSTLRVMKAHFEFGAEKCKAIGQNIAQWADLFEPFKFFEQYFLYLHIDLTASSENNLMTLRWNMEAELRMLISKVEESKDLICHPCPVDYASSDSCAFFVGLASEIPAWILDVFQRRFNTWGLRTPDMELGVYHVLGQEMGSRKWGKHSLPVVGMPAALP